MQLLCEWALHIHFSERTTAVSVCSCCMSDLRSYTFVLLSALLIWIYHPVCSCSVKELRSYTFVLFSALPIWIYHPVCSCFVKELRSYTFVLLSALLIWILALSIWIYCPVCSCFVSELCSYTIVLLSALDLPPSIQLLCEWDSIIHFSVTFSLCLCSYIQRYAHTCFPVHSPPS